MHRLGKFLRRGWADQRLLLEAGLVVGAVRVGLWVLPYDRLRRLLETIAPTRQPRQHADRACAERVGWAVGQVAECVPDATCLTRALAAEWILNRLGQPSSLRFGVAKGETGGIEAHAWLESGGTIVVGRLAGLSRYAVLAPPEGERR